MRMLELENRRREGPLDRANHPPTPGFELMVSQIWLHRSERLGLLLTITPERRKSDIERTKKRG
jgi:hypothetical protein